VVIIIATAGALTFVATRDIQPIEGTTIDVSLKSFKAPAKDFVMDDGVMAVGTLEGGLKFTTDANTKYPIASIAKMITLLVVLDKKDSKTDEPEGGPIVLMSAEDDARWWKTVAENGTNLKVVEGQQLSLRQIIEGIVLSSANNLADTLVIWAFGSFDEYKAVATKWLAEKGLKDTEIGADASGLDPGTISTTADLIKLGQLVMKNQTLREIVGLKTAVFPEIGEIENLNLLVGENGFIGIKTGSTVEAGDGLLFANKLDQEIIIGVVLGQKTNEMRFSEAERVMEFARTQVETLTLSAGSLIGRYSLPWSLMVKVVTDREIKCQVWFGDELKSKIKLDDINKEYQAGEGIGEVALCGKKAKLILDDKIIMPDAFWKVSNIDKLVF